MRVTTASILTVLVFCAQARAGSFTQTADAMLSTGAFAGARVGVIFVSLTDGTTPYARGADVPLIPASVAKLASSAAALDALGPDFKFKTAFLAKDTRRDSRGPYTRRSRSLQAAPGFAARRAPRKWLDGPLSLAGRRPDFGRIGL